MSMRLSEFVWQRDVSDLIKPFKFDLCKYMGEHPDWLKSDGPDPEEFYLPKDHELTTKVYDFIHEVIPTFMFETKSWPWQYDNLHSKDYCLKQYTFDKDYTSTRIDTDTKETYNRMIAFVLFLSDQEEGGEYEFEYSGLKVKPEEGKLLMFPCNYLFPYRVHTPKSHDLTILTGYIYNNF